jgi:hypothetical protein
MPIPKVILAKANGGFCVASEDRETAAAVAEGIVEWAREHGALADAASIPRPRGQRVALDVFPENVGNPDDREAVGKAEKTLERIKVVAVAVDAERQRAVVLTKNQVSASAEKLLPDIIDGVRIDYVGQAVIEPNPPPIPQSAGAASPRCFLHNNKLACGSSVTAASLWGAGTLGALVQIGNGQLYGLTNNHVTGGCNHTVQGMHIMCPAPFDADPSHPAPLAIGRHHSFVALASGDPGQVQEQELDVALFEVTRPEVVTSMQGDGAFDTPTSIADLVGGMKVKKVGRTTGLTTGQVLGQVTTALGIPYEAPDFRSRVYFRDVWVVNTPTGDAFSLPGDSGSLVVTEDGTNAVGLVFAGATNGSVSYLIPIRTVLDTLGATLVAGHNV